jgi:hypothetical protein
MTLGTESDLAQARYKLAHVSGRPDLAGSLRASILGRIVSVRASKVMLAVADDETVILGGVDWSDFLKPIPHQLDSIFEVDQIHSVVLGYELPLLIARQVPVVPTKLFIEVDRIPSVTIRLNSGGISTFVPEQEHLMPSIAGVLGDLLASHDVSHISFANDVLRFERIEAHTVESVANHFDASGLNQTAASLKNDGARHISYLGHLRDIFLSDADSPVASHLDHLRFASRLKEALEADCLAFDAMYPAVAEARLPWAREWRLYGGIDSLGPR